MPEIIPILRSSSGLNVKTDPARIRFDPETGVQDLAAAVNVDHDRTGRISRRKGFTATAFTSAAHSLWWGGGACLFVSGTSLYILSSSYTASAVATVTAGARVRYLHLDTRDYWMNGHEKGFVEAGANNAWVKGAYVGPDTTRQLSDPPIGHLIAYGHGRAWIAQGSVGWYSEPFDLGSFDLSRNFLPFESRLTMLRPVKGGVFFSDSERTYFGAGTDPRSLDLTVVAESPVIEGTDADLYMEQFGDGSMSGIGAIWTAANGICVGTPGGQVLNLTHTKLNYPNALRGAGICVNGRYVATLEP